MYVSDICVTVAAEVLTNACNTEFKYSKSTATSKLSTTGYNARKCVLQKPYA